MSIDRSADAALATLFLPFRTGRLSWPTQGALFLRARYGAPLHELPLPGLICEQSFKPDAMALEHSGFIVSAGTTHTVEMEAQRWPLVLILPPRQREEARALFARALSLIQPGGRIIASISNNEGARSSESDLAQLVGPVATLTKNKCRVFWSEPLPGAVNRPLASQWQSLDAVRPIAAVRSIDQQHFVSRPGIFAWDRIDAASALLAAHLPADLAGRAADLGAGFGFLATELLARCPRITALDLYEAEHRALDVARQNLGAIGTVPLGFHWHDVTSGLPQAYDVIVTNPPFHTQSRHDRPDIGRRFITIAAQALQRGGQLWLVANRHLPYEAVLNHNFGTVRTVGQQHGFKIIAATRSGKMAGTP